MDKPWNEITPSEALANLKVLIDKESGRPYRAEGVILHPATLKHFGLTMVAEGGKGYFQRADGTRLTDSEALAFMANYGTPY